MLKVLLTGAKGFLGSAIARNISEDDDVDLILHARNASSGFTGCNLVDANAVKSMLLEINPDVIIHTAAFVPKRLQDYKNEILNNNILMVENLVNNSDACFINISSMTVYGKSEAIYRNEESETNPESLYGINKLKIEEYLKQCGRKTVSIRIPGLFGVERKTGIIYGLLSSIYKNEKPKLPSEPLLWAAMNVDDAAESILKVFNKISCGDFDRDIINIGYRDVLSINKLINACCEISDLDIKTEVMHPEFAFNLALLERLEAVPACSFKSALIKVKSDYGF